ncbi:MAG: hypothetical protein K6F61_07540 [Clostridiales bacterium]|nr:hypothetical protein [Clostridiales bacterium]
MDKSDPNTGINNNLGLTVRSDHVMQNTPRTQAFQDYDSLAIYNMLLKELNPIDFSFYLKRYIYQAAGYKADFKSVPLEDYLETIIQAFSSRGVPPSLRPSGTKLRAAAKNWLSQKTVSRETVMILAFGLDMDLETLNRFLTKALQECSLSPKDPVETICWYCVKNRLGFYRFRQLIAEYETLPGTAAAEQNIDSTATAVLRNEVTDICGDKSLMRYLNQLRRPDGKTRQSVDAKSVFNRLYDEAREIIAGLNNSIEGEKNEVETGRLQDKLLRNDRLYDEQKQEQIREFAGQRKTWTKEDITPVNFEEVLFSAVPRDRNGNLIPMKGSTLNEQFRGKRLNRQHLQEILDGTGTINRYDLATMSFFVISQKLVEEEAVKRYRAFIDETNSILDYCGMGELYTANPYDAFLMICMLTEYPLGTYADIWEMSYEPEEG